jgi:serine-type D-Ala-D-Ala carboxypeptidase (penicillin-binding protein 5/6)
MLLRFVGNMLNDILIFAGSEYREVTAIIPCTSYSRQLRIRYAAAWSILSAITLCGVLGLNVASAQRSKPRIKPVQGAASEAPPPGEIDDPNALAPPPPPGPRVPPKALTTDEPMALPKVRALSAILMDADTGQVIYEKDADAQRPMASTTKIMTALLFTESVDDKAVVTASKNACKIHNCSIHLKLGEQLTAHDLLRAILIRSANDACVAAAEAACGSQDAFVARMNAKAQQLGALRTHFANPHGLTAPDHFTTARDLANIARAVVKQKRIMQVVRLLDCTINRSICKSDVNLHNYSHFVGRYDGAEGLKSGWTTPSGHCYVGVASRHGWRLISVVLNTPEYGSDTTKLMDFGFGQYERVKVLPKESPVGDAPVNQGLAKTVPAHTTAPLTVVVPRGDAEAVEKRVRFAAPRAPIAKGAVIGTLEAWVGGVPVVGVPVVANQAVAAMPPPPSSGHSVARGFFYVFCVFALGLVSLRYGNRKKKRYMFASPSKGSGRSWPRVS